LIELAQWIAGYYLRRSVKFFADASAADGAEITAKIHLTDAGGRQPKV
jgi:hypothetical protein